MSLSTLPNLRVTISDFFDHDLTYITILHHIFLYLGVNSLTWKLYNGPSNNQDDADSSSKSPERTYGLSHKVLIFYVIAYSARMFDFLKPLHPFTYDFAVTTGFTVLFWWGIFVWLAQQKERIPFYGQSRMELNSALFMTGLMAYTYSYDDDLTLAQFCATWSHYLEAIAMIPQLLMMSQLHKESSPVPTSLWLSVHSTALARIFQLLNQAYLFYDADILDQLRVLSASIYLLSYVVFLGTILFQCITGNEIPKESESESEALKKLN